MAIKRITSEIEETMFKAREQMATGTSKCSGMTYEEGVEAALMWVLGNSNDNPMED